MDSIRVELTCLQDMQKRKKKLKQCLIVIIYYTPLSVKQLANSQVISNNMRNDGFTILKKRYIIFYVINLKINIYNK